MTGGFENKSLMISSYLLILSKMGQIIIKSLDTPGCYKALGRHIHSGSGNACLTILTKLNKTNRYKVDENRWTLNVRKGFLTIKAGKVGKAFQQKQQDKKILAI